MKLNIPFDLEVLENFLCPNCRKQLRWEEVVCPHCHYSLVIDEIVIINTDRKVWEGVGERAENL